MAQLVVLVNRSSKTLQGLWDGKHYQIAPGKHSFNEIMASKFKEQNPIMGSEDLRTGQMEYLIGIEEFNDDCSPIEQSEKIERWDRVKMGGPAVEIVQTNAGGLFATERQHPLPVGNAAISSEFSKP